MSAVAEKTRIESGEFCVGYKAQTFVPVMDDQDVEIAEWVSEIEEYMGIPREIFLRKVYNVVKLMGRQACQRSADCRTPR